MDALIIERCKLAFAGVWVVAAMVAANIVPSAPAAARVFELDAADGTANGTSFNWSGYVATNGSFNSVMGAWTVPTIGSSGAVGSDATWVGIGGVTANDLIQSGTEQSINASGQTRSSAFIEMLPRSAQTIPVAVAPGDAVSVSVTQVSGNQWRILFNNTTNGQKYQTTVTYSSSLSSAEWIEEAPSVSGGIVPLDNFGSVRITGGTALLNKRPATISQASSKPVTMIDSACAALATPSSLGADGKSFSVARSAVTPSPSTLGRVPGLRRQNPGSGRFPPAPRTGSTCSSGTSAPFSPFVGEIGHQLPPGYISQWLDPWGTSGDGSGQ